MRGLRREGSAGADARERWGARALSQARHGGGEMAAAELDWAAWQGEERSSAKVSGAGVRRGAACGGGGAGGDLRPSTAAAALLCSDGR